MKAFEKLVTEARQLLNEELPAPGPAPDMGGGEMPAPDMGGDIPDMGGGEAPAPEEDMDNETKKEADPMAYVEETLANLVDPQAGIAPELFSDWIDTFGVGMSKVRDKEGFKQFYGDFYTKLQDMLEIKDQMKDIFDQLHMTLKDVISTKTGDPQTASTTAGAESAKGPGV